MIHQPVHIGWNYIWRFTTAALVGAAGAATLSVGISINSRPLIISGIVGISLVGVIFFLLIMPWLRRWERSLPAPQPTLDVLTDATRSV